MLVMCVGREKSCGGEEKQGNKSSTINFKETLHTSKLLFCAAGSVPSKDSRPFCS